MVLTVPFWRWSNFKTISFLNYHVFFRGKIKPLSKQREGIQFQPNGIRILEFPSLWFWLTEMMISKYNWRTWQAFVLSKYRLIPISLSALLKWFHISTTNPWGEGKSLGWLGLPVVGEGNACAWNSLSVASTVDPQGQPCARSTPTGK